MQDNDKQKRRNLVRYANIPSRPSKPDGGQIQQKWGKKIHKMKNDKIRYSQWQNTWRGKLEYLHFMYIWRTCPRMSIINSQLFREWAPVFKWIFYFYFLFVFVPLPLGHCHFPSLAQQATLPPLTQHRINTIKIKSFNSKLPFTRAQFCVWYFDWPSPGLNPIPWGCTEGTECQLTWIFWSPPK